MPQPVKVGILKVGCLGTMILLEYLLDERAERTDLITRTISTGSKMNPQESEDAAMQLIEYKPDLATVISPNAALPGPRIARETLAKRGIPTIVISDSPAKRIAKDLEQQGIGYIINEADAMIGARREFLDPTEVAVYNADVLKVLAVTGTLALIVKTLDRIIDELKNDERPNLPHLIITREKALTEAAFTNPYAKAKAAAAFEIARAVSNINIEACFVLQQWEQYTTLTAAAHEMMRRAAKLADEARELEKGGDTLARRPHAKDGTSMYKTHLLEKPTPIHSVQKPQPD
ncbi:MAG: F420-dependent methylenetetrahydromethanopterin dehydrogenase [Candidatus Bathyarchaeia archaeon]